MFTLSDMRKKTFKVLLMGNIIPDDELPLTCTNCGQDAYTPIKRPKELIIAVTGMGIITDPATSDGPQITPAVIQCRKCKMVYIHEGYEWQGHQNKKTAAKSHVWKIPSLNFYLP